MNYKISSIAEILDVAAPEYPDYNVSALLTDSRSVTDGEGVLFFALRTRTNDGHNFIAGLYDRGVRNFVVDHIPAELADRPGVNMLVVDDVVKALQRIGNSHRSRFDLPVIAVTGSRGKTTVKEWLYQLLNSDMNVVRSPRSYNSQIGVPLSLWQLDADADIAIFEAGISRAGEMRALEEIISPTIGVMTNIGDEHSDGFASVEEKCREKISLFQRCGHVVYNADDPLIARMMDEAGIPLDHRCGWSRTDSSAPLFVGSERIDGDSTSIAYQYRGEDGAVTIPFTSRQDVENALHCLSVLLLLGISPAIAADRMRHLSAVDTRLNVMEGVNNCMLIHDSYTSDLNSLAPALDFMSRRMTAGRQATVILSDVTHEQLDGDTLYRMIAELLVRRTISRFIGVGPEMMRHSALFGGNARFFGSTTEFLAEMSTGDFDSELILVKGAPQFRFDRISEMLEARHHETVLEVNLDAVVHNFNHFRSMLRPSTGIVVMVKASGYGAGAYELAKTLQAQGAAYLAVAVLDEGVELRRAGITMPIMVLNPKVVNYNSMFAHALEPEVFTFEMLDEIIREAGKRGIENYPVHIKFDTGMHRLGFLEADIPELIERISKQKAVAVKSVFSHLATADCADMDDYTRMQLDLFDQCCEKFQQGLSYRFMRHVLNSAGIARFPEYQYDMVRLGICLYGVATMDIPPMHGLKPVSSLRSIVISVKEWEAGTTVGYGRKGVLRSKATVATIPVGYADGVNRHLGNGHASFWINGHRCPTIGNICMDACMVDVTGADCKVGDSVEIFGDNVTVYELADILDTIPYEVLTSVSTRVKRIYYRE